MMLYIFHLKKKNLYEDDSFLEMSALRFYNNNKKSIVGKITQALHFIEMYGHVGERWNKPAESLFLVKIHLISADLL